MISKENKIMSIIIISYFRGKIKEIFLLSFGMSAPAYTLLNGHQRQNNKKSLSNYVWHVARNYDITRQLKLFCLYGRDMGNYVVYDE